MSVNWKEKIMGGLILGSLVLSLTAVAVAQEPRDAPVPIPEAMQSEKPFPEDPTQRLRARLDILMRKKVLDADQARRVMLLFQQKDHNRKAEWQKVKGMTPEERDAYMENQCIKRCQNRPDLIKDLMEHSGLSREQAVAVAQEMRPPHGPAPNGVGPDPGGPPPGGLRGHPAPPPAP